MVKPIGQTFFVNEPPAPTGVKGVYIKEIDIYLERISSTFGLTMEIRETDNGAPTPSRLPFAQKVVQVSDVYSNGISIIRSSTNGAIPTKFLFDTPVFLESSKSYAFVIIPNGGNDDYRIFVANTGAKDISSNTTIYKTNETGALYLSTNDLDWVPQLNVDLKHNIYIAEFTADSGNAYFITPDEEWVTYTSPIGDYIVRESVVFSNNYYNHAVLTISGSNGTFSVGQTVYQGNTTANSMGTIYSANSSVIKVANVTGAFSQTSVGNTSTYLYNANTSANCYINLFYQNVVTSNTSNTITVPDSSVITNSSVLFISTSNKSYTQVVQVTGIPNATTISVNNAIKFTDNSALYGRVKANGALRGGFSGSITYGDGNFYGVLDATTSNTASNLSGVSNVQMIGISSGASSTLLGLTNPPYNSLTTNFSQAVPFGTTIDWSFKGLANNGAVSTTNFDGTFKQINFGIANEFTDKERLALSRSTELTSLSSNNSVTLLAAFASSNSKISPAIDTTRTNVVYTYNIVAKESEINGYYLKISNTSSNIATGDIIQQVSYGNTAYGTVHTANSTFILLTNVNGKFTSNVAFTNFTNSNTGFVNVAEHFSEANNNGYFKASRYISKNILLADGQDSEDMRTYIAAYRPSGTNINMYSRVQASVDNESFDNRAWTKLKEISPASLQSSSTNSDDRVELVYGFNQSEQLFAANVSGNTTSTNVSCESTLSLSNNSFVYIQANTSSKSFNVREVVYVINSNSFVIDRPLSFTTSNAMLGLIPGIESTTSAFLFDQNNNILRYTTENDAVYDSYIQFAMKIVPIANSSALVPRVSDLRVIALQI